MELGTAIDASGLGRYHARVSRYVPGTTHDLGTLQALLVAALCWSYVGCAVTAEPFFLRGLQEPTLLTSLSADRFMLCCMQLSEPSIIDAGMIERLELSDYEVTQSTATLFID